MKGTHQCDFHNFCESIMLSTAFGYTCKPFTRGGSKLKGHLYTFMLATHPSPPHTNITIRQHAILLPRDLALYISLLLSISLLIYLYLSISLSIYRSRVFSLDMSIYFYLSIAMYLSVDASLSISLSLALLIPHSLSLCGPTNT